MKKHLLIGAVVLVTALVTGNALSADYDLSGKWAYSTSNQSVKGMCPVGPNSKGICQMSQNANKFTLVFLTGRTCKPASMCAFTGKVTANKYTGSNSATVDDEGGKATNSIVFTLSSKTKASGSEESTYTHPGGFRCDWRYDILLNKNQE